jgi:hypothetical protein
LAASDDGTCLAVVNHQEIWRRALTGTWSKIASAAISLQSLAAVGSTIFCGGSDEAALIRIPASGTPERLRSFDATPGRHEWFAGGPPLGVRSLTSTADHAAIFAAVHVGGIPRSDDGGQSWRPTIPVLFDVHEVRSHPSNANIVAAATAVGLCVSHNAGQHWEVFSEGLDIKNSLALAALENEVLFGVSDGPFAKQSQVWRWTIGGRYLERVADGLPDWLPGKVDTNQIAAGCGRAAIVDGGGNLWLSRMGSTDWTRIATGVPYASGLLIL